jgi:hypothetical protein
MKRGCCPSQTHPSGDEARAFSFQREREEKDDVKDGSVSKGESEGERAKPSLNSPSPSLGKGRKK